MTTEMKPSFYLNENYFLKLDEFEKFKRDAIRFVEESNSRKSANDDDLRFIFFVTAKAEANSDNFEITKTSIEKYFRRKESFEIVRLNHEWTELGSYRSRTARDRAFVFFLNDGDEITEDFLFISNLISANPKKDIFFFDGFYQTQEAVKIFFRSGLNGTQTASTWAFQSGILMSEASFLQNVRNLEGALSRKLPSSFFYGLFEWKKLNRVLLVPVPLIRYKLGKTAIASWRDAKKVEENSVSVVICTKNKGYLLKNLVSDLLGRSGKFIRDIVIISNNTDSAHAIEVIQEFRSFPKVKVEFWQKPFSFAKQSNLGAVLGEGKYLLFMNDDIMPISERWLERLIEHARHEDVGAVGALLFYPDETIQHGGMFLGFNRVAGHAYRFAGVQEIEDFYMFGSARECAAVTGAVFMIRKDVFEALNGFDSNLDISLQDLDLSLRILETGKKIVFEPSSRLFHFESSSVKKIVHEQTPKLGREYDFFSARWKKLLEHDIYEHPFFSHLDESRRKIFIRNY